MFCAVSKLSKMAARQATMFKIYYHMVKMTNQVQKIKSGCISVNIPRRALKSYRTGVFKNVTTEWKNFKQDCNMVMKAKE